MTTDNNSNQINNWKYERLAEDTISGIDLRIRELKQIKNIITFDNDEDIEIIYRDTAGFEKYFSVTEKKIVAITNKRIFSMEKNIIQSTFFDDIKSCQHIKNNIFRWDQILIVKNNGLSIAYGIYYSETAKLFVNHINNKLQK
jgi:hypothetical protein